MDYSGVDPKDADGVGSAQLAAVVNRFAVTTCTFLASFAAECEARLGEQEARMQRVEAAVTLLEQKLGESASVWFCQIVLKPPVCSSYQQKSLTFKGSTECGIRSVQRFCQKFAWQFRRLVG